MDSFKKWLVLLIFIFFTLLLILSCNSNKTKKPEEIKLLVLDNSLSSSPIYAGICNNFFQEEGLKPTLIKEITDKKPLECLVDGTCDVLIIGSNNSFNILDNPSDEKTNIFACFGKKDFSFLVTRKKSDVFSWQELRGKVIIGGESEYFSYYYLKYLLRKFQLRPHKDVDIIQNVPLSLAIGAFKGGLGNYIHLFEPEVSKLESNELGYSAFFLGNLAETPFPLALTTESYLHSHSEIIQKLTNAFYKSQIWFNNNNPEDILPAIMDYYPQSNNKAILKALHRGKSLNIWAENPLINEDSVNNVANILNESRLRRNEIILNTKINNSFAEKAVAKIKLPAKEK